MSNKVLTSIEEIGYEKLYKILLAYTHARMKTLYWNHGKNTTTKGKAIEDYPGEAIIYALENPEKWKIETYPAIEDYLKQRISTDLSNSINSKENKQGVKTEIEDVALFKNSDSFADQRLLVNEANESSKERLEIYRKAVKELIKDDNDYIEFVFDEMVDGHFKPQIIAQRLDMEVKKVDRYKFRIKSAIQKTLKDG